MKRLIIRCFFCILILNLAGIGCIQYQDPAPGISIYKTNSDYFEFIDIGMKEGHIIRTSSYLQDTYRFNYSGGDTIYKYRQKLINGYVLDFEADERYDVFLNLTFKECINLESVYSQTPLSHDTLKHYIIDTNPYIEFYRDMQDPRYFRPIVGQVDTAELNKIIRDGQIEVYFTRLK